MRNISEHTFAQNVAEQLQKVVDDGEPIIIQTHQGKNLVILAESDYQALRATLREFASPTNIERLDRIIARLEDKGDLDNEMSDA